MKKISDSTFCSLIDRLISLTKESKLEWNNANHYDAPDYFDEYASNLVRTRQAILSDSFVTKFQEGYFYLIHICDFSDIPNISGENFNHSVLDITTINAKNLDDGFLLCVQPNYSVCLEELFSDFPQDRSRSKLYSLQQLIIRANSQVEAFISNFLESTT